MWELEELDGPRATERDGSRAREAVGRLLGRRPPGRLRPRLLAGHTMPIMAVDITPDGRRAVSGSWGRVLRVWNLDAGECVHVLRGHRGIVSGVAVSDDGRYAASSSEDMTVRLWDLEAGRLLATFTGTSWMRCDLARDASVVLAGERSGRVHVLVVIGLRAE